MRNNLDYGARKARHQGQSIGCATLGGLPQIRHRVTQSVTKVSPADAYKLHMLSRREYGWRAVSRPPPVGPY